MLQWWYDYFCCDSDDDDDHGDVDEYDLDNYKMLIIMLELLCLISICSTWCNIRYVDDAMLLWYYSYDDDSNGYDDMMIVYVY